MARYRANQDSRRATDRELEEIRVRMLESQVFGVLARSRWSKAGHEKGCADLGEPSPQNQKTVEAIRGYGLVVLKVHREGE